MDNFGYGHSKWTVILILAKENDRINLGSSPFVSLRDR